MSATSALLAGRRAMEALMLDSCVITRPGEGEPVWNEETGQYDHPEPVTVYAGKCRIQVKADINSNVVETTAGEREWTYLTATLQLPIDGSELVRIDNVATLTACPHDASMVNRLFNIQGIYHKSDATHRRMRVKEVVG